MRAATVVLVLTILASTSTAQVRFGQRVGVGICKQEFDLVDGYEGYNFYRNNKYKCTGFTAAFFVDVPVTARFLVGAEVAYSERGNKIKGFGSIPGSDSEFELLKAGYAGLSVLPKFRMGNGSVQLEVFAGAEAAVRLNLRSEYPQLLISEPDEWPPLRDREHYASGQDYSAIAGLGIVAGGGPVKFHLNGRYVHGLTNFYDRVVQFTTVEGYHFGEGRMYNRGFHLCFGFSVPLSVKAWGTPVPAFD